MNVTFHLRATCSDCGVRVKGVQVTGVRVNLHSLRTDGEGLVGFQPCKCPRDQRMTLTDVETRLDPESAAKVEARRTVLRARNKAKRDRKAT